MDQSDKQIASLLEATGDWAASAADRFGSTVKLAVAEARLAALSVVMMVAIAVMIALALFVTWSLIVVVMGLALNNLGLSLVSICLLLALLNVALIAALVVAMNRVSRALSFRATRNTLSSTPPGEPVDEMVAAKA